MMSEQDVTAEDVEELRRLFDLEPYGVMGGSLCRVEGTGPTRLRQLGLVEIGVYWDAWVVDWADGRQVVTEGLPGHAARLTAKGVRALCPGFV